MLRPFVHGDPMKLSAAQRQALPSSAFALPGRRFPIHDEAHARQALRMKGHATPAEQALIEKKVYARYPNLRPMEKRSGDAEKRASVEYRGKTFPGYNQPVDSDRAGKKKMVLVKRGDRVKLVHFGQQGYRHNYSEEAKRNYLRRSAGIKGKDGRPTKDDPFSPNYWARKVLWPEGEKTAAVPGAVKQYRRYLQAVKEGVAVHTTKPRRMASILSDGVVRPGRNNYYGKGTYWNAGIPSAHGPVGVQLTGASRELPRPVGLTGAVGDESRKAWRVHNTDTGTPVGRKDTLVLAESVPGDAALVSAARAKGLRVVEPEAVRAYNFSRRGLLEVDGSTPGKGLTGEAKRDLIRKVRKRRKQEARAAGMEKEAALDFLGAGLRAVGAKKAGDRLIRAHQAGGDAVERRVKGLLSWEVPGTQGVHLPGLKDDARRNAPIDKAAKMSRMGVEDPVAAALIAVPLPGSVPAGLGVKAATDAVRRRLRIQPEMGKSASIDPLVGSIVGSLLGGPVGGAMTRRASPGVQAGASMATSLAASALGAEIGNRTQSRRSSKRRLKAINQVRASRGMPPLRMDDIEKTAKAQDPSKFCGKVRLPLSKEDHAALADLKRRAGKSGFSAVRTSAGVAIYTHRARTPFYPSFDKIPVARARFIDSTG